jgi:hypothetical protein
MDSLTNDLSPEGLEVHSWTRRRKAGALRRPTFAKDRPSDETT